MSVVKRVLSLVFACLMAFTFPSIIISGVLNSTQDSQEQESVIDFDKPVFEIVFPIEPICYRNPVESEQSEPSLESDIQECDVVVSSIEDEQNVEEQYSTEEYDDPDNNFDFECYDNEDVVFDEIEENTDEYDYGYDNEEYEHDYEVDEQQSVIPPEQFQEDGVELYNGYYWTYYSELALPGENLDIPGRYTDCNGYVCDENDYICLASDSLPRGTVVSTPFGKDGKVYDCGCGNDYVLDVYCNW